MGRCTIPRTASNLRPIAIETDSASKVNSPIITLEVHTVDTSQAIADYLVECGARGLASSTMAQYQWALRRMEKVCAEVPARGRELLPALSDLALAQESRRDLVKCWRTFFNWYISQAAESNVTNPIHELSDVPKHPKLPRVLSSCLLYTSPSPRDRTRSRMPSSA